MSYIGNTPFTAAFLTDTFSGNGTTVAFTMSVAPANTSSIIVAITGVVQDPSTYSVAGTTLTFSAAPPSGTSNISVRYLGIPASGVTTTAYRTVTDTTATAGQTTFTIPSYTVGYVDVYRNGVRLAAADYTATTGTTVVLASAASAGDTITTESFYVSSVLNAIPATNASVQQTYLASGVAGTGPAFGAYLNTVQTGVSNSTWTTVQVNTKEFDTASCFNNTGSAVGGIPAYSFLPNIAGYYQVNGSVQHNASTTNPTFVATAIYKNGSIYKQTSATGNTTNNGQEVCCLVYLNGTTDYITLYAYMTGSTAGRFDNGIQLTYLQASMVRAA